MSAIELGEVLRIVALELGRREVAAEDRLEDLGARSMDLVAVAAALEDRFGVAVSDEALGEVRRVGDFHRLLVDDGG
ncbi:MAG: phosphopantetheine-binding protein [Thermoanaerobaculia bacterium]